MTTPKLRLVSPATEPAATPTARPVTTTAARTRGVRGPHAELADDSLVALAIGGDARACEALYRRHAGFAVNLATRIAGSTNDVEDVVHDAFIRAFERLPSLRNPKVFRSWLGSIVVHAMRSRLRRSRLLRLFGLGRGGDPIDIEHIASETASPRTRAELAQVYALLQTLATDDRIAWTLRYVEGHDLKMAADLADCSLATIKRRIRRAQQHIQANFVDAQAPASERPGALQDEAPPVRIVAGSDVAADTASPGAANGVERESRS